MDCADGMWIRGTEMEVLYGSLNDEGHQGKVKFSIGKVDLITLLNN